MIIQKLMWMYPLVMTNSLPWYRWPIEIDGLPFLNMVDLSMAMLNNQRVYIYNHMYTCIYIYIIYIGKTYLIYMYNI